MGQIGQYQQAKAGYAWQKEVHRLNTEAALRAATENYAALGKTKQQVEQQAAQEGFEALRDMRLSSASAGVAAAGAGVMGQSTDDIRQTFSTRYAELSGVRMQNMRASQRQIYQEMQAVRTQAEGRIMQTLPGPRPKFNWLGLGGSLAGAGANYGAMTSKTGNGGGGSNGGP